MADVSINISKEIEAILDDYREDVKQAANNAMDIIAKKAVTMLKDNSPKDSGEYARGWALRRTRGGNGVNTVIVYNKKKPQLTHLLEHGHTKSNQAGSYGRTSAKPHIKPVEEWAKGALPLEIERELT